MESVWDKAVKAFAAFSGAVAGAFGGFDPVFRVLLACMVVDYISGVIVAVMGKSSKTASGGLDSKIGARGIAKKGLMLLVVLVAALLDSALGTEQQIFRSAVIWFYVANEALSILENMALANVPFPQRLLNALEQIKRRNNLPKEGGE